MKGKIDVPWRVYLTPEQCLRAAQLLHNIIQPGECDFNDDIAEAQALFGYKVTIKKPRSRRSFYGIHAPPKPKDTSEKC